MILHPSQLKGIPFVFRNVHGTEDPAPLNKFLLDEDCVYILKRCYQDNTKNELADDECVMKNFFGSAGIGKRVLGEISDEMWEAMD